MRLFQDHPAIITDLDTVDEDDQITHMLALEDGDNPEDGLSQYSLSLWFVSSEPAWRCCLLSSAVISLIFLTNALKR